MDQNEIFDRAEELVGIYPPPDGLRNAIHAILVETMRIDSWAKSGASSASLSNMEYFAKKYEAIRGNEQFTHPMA